MENTIYLSIYTKSNTCAQKDQKVHAGSTRLKNQVNDYQDAFESQNESNNEWPATNGSEISKRSIVLFRKVNGNAWVSIVRKPSGKINGWMQREGSDPVRLNVREVPRRIRLEDMAKARAVFEESRLRLTSY